MHDHTHLIESHAYLPPGNLSNEWNARSSTTGHSRVDFLRNSIHTSYTLESKNPGLHYSVFRSMQCCSYSHTKKARPINYVAAAGGLCLFVYCASALRSTIYIHAKHYVHLHTRWVITAPQQLVVHLTRKRYQQNTWTEQPHWPPECGDLENNHIEKMHQIRRRKSIGVWESRCRLASCETCCLFVVCLFHAWSTSNW